MTHFRQLALAATLALATGATFAGPARAGGFWDIYGKEQERIRDGVHDGSLAPWEARRLEEQQQQIRRQRDRLADNGLSREERERLFREQSRQSQSIYDLRHNDHVDRDRRYADRDDWRDRDRDGWWDRDDWRRDRDRHDHDRGWFDWR